MYTIIKRPEGITRRAPSTKAVKMAKTAGLDPKQGIVSPTASYLEYPLSTSQCLVFKRNGVIKLVTEGKEGEIPTFKPVGPEELKKYVSKLTR